jgi:hypothetical protein
MFQTIHQHKGGASIQNIFKPGHQQQNFIKALVERNYIHSVGNNRWEKVAPVYKFGFNPRQ